MRVRHAPFFVEMGVLAGRHCLPASLFFLIKDLGTEKPHNMLE